MRTSLSKKLLAGLLSLVMVLSLVAPSMGTQAASKYSLTDKKSVKSDVTFKYQLKGVSKNQYVKVTRNVSGETVKYNKKAVSKTTKINGTGKTLNLYVTYGDKVANYTGKFTVKIYSKKTNKVVKTIVEKTTVKVKELSITGVEPTTAASGATGYKYIRVNFNKALDKIGTDDIEIRAKATQQLYTVESIKLSNGNKSADITIKGDASVAGTTFLKAGAIYTVSFNQSGVTATLQFELPNFLDEQTVVAANVAKKQVKVGATWYTVPASYTGNLGELVGRTVSFGYNGDDEMSSLNVKEEKVVYADVTLTAATATEPACFHNSDSWDVYEFCTTGTTTNAVTTFINAATGKTMAAASANYAKLVMNSNGTVRVAVLETLSASLVCTSVSGDTVTQDKNTTLSLKDYTIEKDGKYITAAEIAKGDVVYYDATNKFADVYAATETGKLGTVFSNKAVIGEGTYFYGAPMEYFNKTTELYTAANDAYLLGLDKTQDVTVTLTRDGSIRVISGTEATSSTTGRYLVTKATTGYFTDADGEGVVVYATKDGKNEKLMARADAWKTTPATDWATFKVANSLKKGQLVDLTFNAKGVIVDAKVVTAVTATATDKTVAGNDTNLEATDTVLKVGDNTYNMSAATTVWIATKVAGKEDTVVKTTLGDFKGLVASTTGIAVANGEVATDGVDFVVKDAKVTDIIIYNLAKTSSIVSYKTGIVYNSSIAKNAENDYELVDFTLITKEGTKKYTVGSNTVKGYNTWAEGIKTAKTFATDGKISSFEIATLGLDKDGNIVDINVADTSDVATCTNAESTWTASGFTVKASGLVVTPSANATVYDLTNYAKNYSIEETTVNDIAANFAGGKTGTVTYHKEVGTTTAWSADVIYVIYDDATTAPSTAGTITMSNSTANEFDADAKAIAVGFTGKLKATYNATGTTDVVESIAWYLNNEKIGEATSVFDDGASKDANGSVITVAAGDKLQCRMTLSNGKVVASDVITVQARAAKTISGAGADAVPMTNPGETTMTGVTVVDQFGAVVKNATLTVTNFDKGTMVGVTDVSLKTDETGKLVVKTTGEATADGSCTMKVLGKTLTLTTSDKASTIKLAVTSWS